MSKATLPLRLVEDSLGKDKIRYFLYLNGRWRWRPSKAMRACGFGLVTMGRGGPGKDAEGNPAASIEDQGRAIELNRAWDHVRSGQQSAPARTTLVTYPEGSVGRGYQRAMEMRKAARVANGIIWTKEQEKRDSWPRAWKWLDRFGDCDPRTIEPEHFLRIDAVTGEPKGLVAEIEAKVSTTERHMVIKVWRALWKKMAGMKYCDLGADPAKTFPNTPPKPRDQIWLRSEVLTLVQVAWRNEYYGLAALMAVAWDSMFSPVDARTLTPAQCQADEAGMMFFTDRAKTGKAAAATLTQWSRAILVAYVERFGAELLDTTPLFWTRGGKPVARDGATGQWGGDHGGGKHVPARPYTKSSLNQDFRKVRELAFGKDEKRQLQDMRRSGAVEGDAGGGSIEDQANKMANTVDRNKQLRKTYNPVNIASVRRFDEARAIGAQRLEEQRASKSVTSTPLVTLLKQRREAK
ncbi:MAG TPA: hypothetical protein VNX23_18150 [Bradyrhizobium sp.]|uniref:hypothetical protein n=1 Tax=Bradyrhizobium sp. TaxID=376 RepID=UPI002C1D03C1|nr:hypothetical protein [Bradyrhizobium sp.]HXB79299.1 hypothetical protein [Bradyrhizobium sp.]